MPERTLLRIGSVSAIVGAILAVIANVLATSESGTHWEPRDQGLDGGLVSSLRALL